MIIIEGPDNSGKTTLINHMQEIFPNLIRVKSPGPLADYDWWMGELKKDPDELVRTIYDRFLYSEFVYGPLVRGKVSLSPLQHSVVSSMLNAAKPLVIRCRLIDDRGAFESRPQLFAWETACEAERLYDRALAGAPIYDKETDPSHQSIHELIDDYRVNKAPKWLVKRKSAPYGRGELNNPDWMIVGERFSRDNKHKVPFERSRSAHLLLDAIHAARDYGLIENPTSIWFTNAVKDSEPMTPLNLQMMEEEIATIQPRRIISLGNRPSGVLSMVGASHIKVYHPSYFLRRGSRNAGGDFVQAFLERLRGE